MILIDKSASTAAPASASVSVVRKFDDVYRVEERLHTGAYGTVYRAIDPALPNKSFAVKIIERKNLRRKDEDDVLSEVAVMRDVAGMENVVELIDFFAEPDRFYIVQGLALGGDVFDRVYEGDLYKEDEARILVFKLLKALRAIHSKGILHRDLKPENILLSRKKDKASILIADFGFATYLPEEGYLTRRCGTPNFISPEVCRKQPYNQSCDLFSVGCILFMVISGLPPFFSNDKKKSFDKVCKGEFDFHGVHWNTVSVSCKQFLMGLLTVDPRQRWTIDQALKSNWIQGGLTENIFSGIDWRPKCNEGNLLDGFLFGCANIEAENIG